MKLEKGYIDNLMQLNDDCLRLIFEKLTLKDQLNLLLLNTRIAEVITSIWHYTYNQHIDFHKENYFEQHQPIVEYELFQILSKRTKQLLNLNVLQSRLLCKDTASKLNFLQTTTLTICETYDSVRRPIEFTENIGEILPKLKIIKFKNISITLTHVANFSHLQTLSLVNATILGNTNSLMELLVKLSKLQHFTFLPRNDDICLYDIHTVLKCQTLQTLELTANELSPIIADIAQLSNLQTLTVFCRESIDACAKHHFILSKLNGIPNKHVTAVTLQCRIDSLILRELKLMKHLKKFSWHSYFHVEYVNQELHWQAYDPKLSSNILELLTSYNDLEYLDLHDNCHLNEEHVGKILKLIENQQKRGKQLFVEFEKNSTTFIERAKEDTCGYSKFEFNDKLL